MDLKSIVKSIPTSAQGVRVPWDEKGEVGFCLLYTGKDILSRSREKSLIRKYDHKTHRIEEKLDSEKFDLEVLRETVVGWWGLKVKYLKDILDPSKAALNLTDAQLEEEVPFNDENRDVILTNYNLTFNNFITSVAMDIEVYRQYKNEELEKNLKTSQLGVGAKA